MSKALAVVVGVILLVLLVLYSTTYTVRFHEVAIKTRYGRASEQSLVKEPGLHFRIPFFADRVTRFDTRLQLVETPKVEVPTADGQSVVVQAFLLWKVGADDALTFFKSFPSKGALEEAQRILEGRLRTAVKGSLSRYAFDDLIGPQSRLADAETAILDRLSVLGSLGIEPVSVGLSQVLLPPKVTTSVPDRMQAVRQKLAAIWDEWHSLVAKLVEKASVKGKLQEGTPYVDAELLVATFFGLGLASHMLEDRMDGKTQLDAVFSSMFGP